MFPVQLFGSGSGASNIVVEGEHVSLLLLSERRGRIKLLMEWSSHCLD